MATTFAYELGKVERSLREGLRRFAEEFAAGLAGRPMPRPIVFAFDEALESARIDNYRRRIAAERRQGLAYVERIARQARHELGLPR